MNLNIWGVFQICISVPLNNIDFANYAEDITPYVIEDDAKEAIGSLKNVSGDIFRWFASNPMKRHPDKCHLIASCDNEISLWKQLQHHK